VEQKLSKLVNDLIVNLLRTRVQFPPPPPLKENNMFDWFKSKKVNLKQEISMKDSFEDSIEEALWLVKEEYDLQTEEVEKTVLDKRENIEYMRKTLKRNI